ncbi:MAG: D-Ala-D-Ala carboxypeptidase family metallohydrolase [Pseudomonadota bacterium]
MSIPQGLYAHWSKVPREDWPWEHFEPYELRCGIGAGAKFQASEYELGSVLVVPAAIGALNRARRDWGRPFVINSAYRSPAYNAAIGGSPNSYHPKGMAFDIDLSDYDRDQLIDCLRHHGFGGLGRYGTVVHADIGPERSW